MVTLSTVVVIFMGCICIILYLFVVKLKYVLNRVSTEAAYIINDPNNINSTLMRAGSIICLAENVLLHPWRRVTE